VLQKTAAVFMQVNVSKSRIGWRNQKWWRRGSERKEDDGVKEESSEDEIGRICKFVFEF
jgi:hypothetical protein